MPRPLSVALCVMLALAACKGGAAAGGAASGQQNATSGGSGPGGNVPSARMDLAPQLLYAEDLPLRAEREFQARGYDGELRRFRELLHSDGLGQLRLDLDAVWNELTSSWVAPHPLYISIYGPRSFFLVRHRDMHLGHEIGLYGNYAWELQPGTLIMAGRTCLLTRARSLHGFGPIDLVYEQATGLLLGWTLYDATGTQVMAKLETTALDLNPNLAGVAWVTDLVPEQPYEAAAHNTLLGIVPRPPTAPPAGFYRAEARVVNATSLSTTIQYLYLERWSDGLRNLFLAQHKIPSSPNADGLLHTARRTQEGGVVTVETDMDDRRVFGVGSLPHEQVEMVVASVL